MLLILANYQGIKRNLEKMKAIILFGHGARDSRWREPFDRLAHLWRQQHPGTPVELAFL